MRELFDVAILAYRNGKYHDALNLMLQVTDAETDNWLAKCYLGMIYTQLGRITDAHRLFKRIVNECPDAAIRARAEGSLVVVEAKMKAKFSKQVDKPSVQAFKPKRPDNDDIAWIG